MLLTRDSLLAQASNRYSVPELSHRLLDPAQPKVEPDYLFIFDYGVKYEKKNGYHRW